MEKDVIDMIERFLDDYLLNLLEMDAPFGDITTEALGIGDKKVKGVIFPREWCVLHGLKMAERVFLFSGVGVKEVGGFKDGDVVEKNEVVLKVEGYAKGVLTGERIALNLLSHLSGVATITRKMVDKARSVNPNIKIAATRKTLPCLGYLQKMAVKSGGGIPHRFSLSDMVLIKDNHIKILGGGKEAVKEALKRVKEKEVYHHIEVEVQDLGEALTAVEGGADIIMLDNFSPESAEEAYRKVKELKSSVIVEVSGGINVDNVNKYAKHADIISSGYITHSTPSVDFTLELE